METYKLVSLSATENAPGAQGLIYVSHDGQFGTLIVEDLPSLGADSQYQLWLIREGKRTDGGVFSVGSDGYAAMVVRSPDPLGSYQAFGITVEPHGGSVGPTGNKVLGGTL
jgi:anti-sigma-K factor RskA